MQASLEKGVTSFHDAGANFATIDIYKQAAADGSLGIRLWVMVRDSNENLRAKLAQYKAVGLNNHHLTIAAIKVTADGALGSRGALMLEPYTDSPSSIGPARRCRSRASPRPRRSPSTTACSCACTPSAIAPIAKC